MNDSDERPAKRYKKNDDDTIKENVLDYDSVSSSNYTLTYSSSSNYPLWTQPIVPPSYNFASLCDSYPDLKSIFVSNGKYSFNNHKSVAKLTQYILKEYYNISCLVPSTRLAPRIPNRYIYLKWLESVTSLHNHKNPVRVVDIGTGSTAIYPLLGCALSNNWSFVATECDKESFESATENLDHNSRLRDRISLVKTSSSDPVFSSSLFPPSTEYCVVMCNPPFFDDSVKGSASFAARIDNTGLVASDMELFCKGGEAGFVSRMIDQSVEFKSVNWFTAMIGQFSSLNPLVEKLHNKRIDNYGIYEIKPGEDFSMSRWILFWSFSFERVPTIFGKKKWLKQNEFHGGKTTFDIDLKCMNSDVYRVVESLDALEMHKKEWGLRVVFPGDVWSRSYRRKVKRAQKGGVMFPEEDKTVFEVAVDDSVEVLWKFGGNVDIFESFTGYLARKLREAGEIGAGRNGKKENKEENQS